MKTSAKKIIFTAITAAAVASTSVPAQAGCGGGGSRRGGISIGFGSNRGGLRLGISQSHYGSRSHQAPVQRHAAVQHYAPVQQYAPIQHSTPVYQSAPVTYAAPLQQSHVVSSPVIQAQPTFTQQSFSQSIPASSPQQLVTQQPTTQQSVTQQRQLSQPTAVRPASSQAVAPQVSVQKGSVQQAATKPTEASALAMLASINQPASKPAISQIPQFSAASTTTAAPHIGNWSVSLPGNQRVTLKLTGDNSFTWTATKDGKSSSFSGQYRLDGGRLSLVRSGDSQKMEGSWTAGGKGFVFKVDGENTGGLSFSKS